LRRFQANEPILARPISWWERGRKWTKRRPALSAVLAVSTLVVGLLILVGVWYHFKILNAFYLARALQNRAERHVDLTRRFLYLADMQLAHQAWKNGSVERVRQLLEKYVPERGKMAEHRGFEWYYLWRLSHGDRLTLARVPLQPVSGLAL